MEVKLWVKDNICLTLDEEAEFKKTLMESLRYDHFDVRIVYIDFFTPQNTKDHILIKFRPFLCEL